MLHRCTPRSVHHAFSHAMCIRREEYQQTLWRLTGDMADSEGLPCPSPQFTYVHLHGIFMYLAWGLLLPLGVLLGRYYKWAWPCWFILHIIVQVSTCYICQREREREVLFITDSTTAPLTLSLYTEYWSAVHSGWFRCHLSRWFLQ